MQKNEKLILQVESLGSEAQGVCRHEGMVVFVPGALPEELVEVQVTKVQRSHAFARLLRVMEASPVRLSPHCPYVPRCGGCSCQHMRYEEELRFKQNQVIQVLRHLGGIEVPVEPVIGMEDPWHYRNKTAMPCAMIDGSPRVGFYAPRSHRLVPVDRCLIAHPSSDLAASLVLKWMRHHNIAPYEEEAHRGLVRHVMTRVNRKDQVMVVLAINATSLPHADSLVELLKSELPGFASLCVSPNTRPGNVILGDTYQCLFGDERLEDSLCGYRFQLSPLSFFQVNRAQAEKLYQRALELADPAPKERVVDLYCGAGTLTSLFASRAGEVIGIEVVPQAIEDAMTNANLNGLTNVSFLQGEAEALLPRLAADGRKADILVLDPPRKGAQEEVLRAMVEMGPRKIVYVSCHPATQARDAKLLVSLGYEAVLSCPVDMFCHTPQVENVLLLERREPCC